jgi:hypothetical protein
MALYLKNEDWRLIAEEVTKETDPKKLTTLIAQLCHALNGESDDKPRQPQHPENPAKPFPDASKPEQHAH